MRRAPIPHRLCGRAPVRGRRNDGRWAMFSPVSSVAAAVILLLPFAIAMLSSAALAQDPSRQIDVPSANAFPKKASSMFGTRPKIDRAEPLYLQADQLIYDTRGNRVIAQGNVEIYYNNYILTADQVIYDQGTNTLTAEGNAQLKDPNGSITRTDRFEALDDFRDAFVQ